MALATQTFFSSSIFQQTRNTFAHYVYMAKELKKCCYSSGVATRAHLRSGVLWLVFAMEALPVLRPYLVVVDHK